MLLFPWKCGRCHGCNGSFCLSVPPSAPRPLPLPPTPRPRRTLSRPRITQLIHAFLTRPPPSPLWNGYPATTSLLTDLLLHALPSTPHIPIPSCHSTVSTPNTFKWQLLRVFGLSLLSLFPPPCCLTLEFLPNATCLTLTLNLHYLSHMLPPSPPPPPRHLLLP